MVTCVIGYALAYMTNFVLGYNYPSHHTLYAFIPALTFYCFYPKKKINFLFVGLAICIGTWRIIGGYHTYLEVLSGILIAIVSIFIVGMIILWVKNGKQYSGNR